VVGRSAVYQLRWKSLLRGEATIKKVNSFLEIEAATTAFNQVEAKSRDLSINTVPHFIINHQVSFSGAQFGESFIRAFQRSTHLVAA
jgi:predicted DsbA family dithiol-disulfide isomerase